MESVPLANLQVPPTVDASSPSTHPGGLLGLTHLITGHSKEGDIRPRRGIWKITRGRHFASCPQSVKSQQAKSKELDVTSPLLCFFISLLITLSHGA
jgi:hypothetical protein